MLLCKLTANGLRIGDGGAFEKRQPTFVQMPNRITNVEFVPKAFGISPTIDNTMLAVSCFFILQFIDLSF